MHTKLETVTYTAANTVETVVTNSPHSVIFTVRMQVYATHCLSVGILSVCLSVRVSNLRIVTK